MTNYAGAYAETNAPDSSATLALRAGFDSSPHQCLSFTLGKEVFALDILTVREIIGVGAITPIPMMPATLRGVINLRGAVVPVIDLSVRFGGEKTQESMFTSIIIVEVPTERGQLVMGVMVDAVNEVLDIPRADIAPAPEFGAPVRVDFIAGMAKLEKGLVILLEISKVFSVGELTQFNKAAERGQVQ
ncbi:CheW-like protein [gamma proteobacterium HdN1]|nr:CheW-like protein [gamma proteobacterium HdN1]